MCVLCAVNLTEIRNLRVEDLIFLTPKLQPMRTRTRTTPHASTTDHAIQRLERNNLELKVFSETLNSYTCEPKTYLLFERLQGIRNRIQRTLRSNQEYIAILKEQRTFFDGQLDGFKQRLHEFRELEQAILDYIGRARMHC